MSDNLEIKLKKSEKCIKNSNLIKVKKGKKYSIVTNFRGLKGKNFCAYFGVIFIDENNLDIGRKIKWINNFSDIENKLQISFESLSSSIILIYRINAETPISSDIHIILLPLNEIKILENDYSIKDDYDNFSDYQAPFIHELTNSEENQFEKKIVWIFGSIRSGTTWLGKSLLDFPENIYWHEPYIGWHLDIAREWNDVPDYFFSNNHKHNWLSIFRKLVLTRTFSQTQTIQKNVIIKEPNGSGGIKILLECLPHSKLIFILRDGRDVVDSIIDSHRPDSWNKDNVITKFEPLLTPEMRINAIKKHCNEWVRITNTVNASFLNHSLNLRCLVKYENLRSNTLEELKKIYKFLEIEIPDDALYEIVDKSDFEKIPKEQKGTGKFARSATPGKWKEHFSEEEQKIMTEIMGDTLQKLGY